MNNVSSFVGQKFGKLTVVKLHHTKQLFYKGKKNGIRYYYLCKCDCGKEKLASLECLRSGHTQSCGCAFKGCNLQDLKGQRFGRLTVISYQGAKSRQSMWLCKCDCGNTIITSANSLKKGLTKSCGCYQREFISKLGLTKALDLKGKRFGKLTAIKRAENSKQNTAKWLCKCDCGNTTIVSATYLANGHTKSCGCLKFVKGRNAKHGFSGTSLNRIYCGIKRRCYVKACKEYKYYGNRGIKMCEDWLNNPKSFYNWATNNGYKIGLTIERIDVNGNYEPNNCKWIERKEQSKNRRTSIPITYNNETHILSEWSEITGIDYRTIKDRIRKFGICDKVFRKGRIND